MHASIHPTVHIVRPREVPVRFHGRSDAPHHGLRPSPYLQIYASLPGGRTLEENAQVNESKYRTKNTRGSRRDPELLSAAKMRDRFPAGVAQNAYSVLEVTGAAEAPRVIFVVSSLLERLVARNEVSKQLGRIRPHSLTVFHGLRAPSISVQKYLDRIFKYANCSPSCFVVAYAYIDRFVTHQAGAVAITSLNVHRLLITSIMVAAKFMDDEYYNNAYYAKVGGITTMEMNRLELEFLFRLGFRLQITVSAFDSYCSHLEREMVLCEGFRVERPILLHACGNSGQDKTQKHPHHRQQQQQQQRMAVWQSYAGV